MKRILVIFLILALTIFLVNGCGNQNNPNNPQEEVNTSNQMVNCTDVDGPMCFLDRMSVCLPVTASMTGAGNVSIEITVIGLENETCHFQRKINDIPSLNCFFPKGTFNSSVLDQTFGNDKGLQPFVDTYCRTG